MRFSMVSSEIRPGIHPSQNSTASRAERDAGCHRTDRRQGGEGVVEGAVRLLHLAVRLENEMVPDPHRVEAEFFGPARTVEELVTTRLFTEVWQQQTELHGHVFASMSVSCPGRV
jgi:hypothetical protein